MIEKIILADMSYLNECVSALQNSELGSVYFSETGKAERALRGGFSKQQVYVAIDKKGICLGFLWYISYGAFNSCPYLHIVAVKESYRGQGIGSQLFKYFEEEIAESSKVFLLVSDSNIRAKALYERIGYKEVGFIPNLYIEGVNEYLMMKVL